MKHRGVFASLRPHPRHLVVAISTAMIAGVFALTLAPPASAAAPPAPYVNGFENAGDAITGVTADTQAMFDVTRVASGTDGIAAAAGGYYAQAAQNDSSTGATLSQFTRLGGYDSTFPVGGSTTSADVYLNTSLATGSNDLRFDWSSAISDPTGSHRRDFVFSVGTSDVANQFVMSASNNAPGWPANPDRDPFTITNPGWYTLQYKFYDAGAGVLAVDMSVLDSAHTVLHTWKLSDPSDIIGTTVGGNRYAWLVDNDFTTLALDNISRTSVPTLGDCLVAVSGSSPVVYTLLADCTTDQTIVVPQNVGGSVFDGNGFSITGVDPVGGHFLGAVIQAQSGAKPVTVKNLTVTVSNLADACDGGNDRLRGILFDGVSGAITNNTVKDLEQGAGGASGCQEGNGIDVRNTASSTPKPNVTISGNTVTDYQKTGIIVTLSTVATITNNIVAGDGSVAYIAQNGIQVSSAATAKLVGNDVSLNNYSPAKVTACGLLIYKASGVSGATKSGLAFIKADNNFHANEEDICNFGKGGTFSPTT